MVFKSKSAAVNQMFTFLFSMIIIGLLFLVGGKAIGSMFEKSCDIDYIALTSQVSRYVDKHNAYNKIAYQELKVPCDYNYLCFAGADLIDNSKTAEILGLRDEFKHTGLLIKESLGTSNDKGAEANIFLVDSDGFIDAIGYNVKLRTPNGIVCVERKNGVFPLKFLGKGKTVEVSGS